MKIEMKSLNGVAVNAPVAEAFGENTDRHVPNVCEVVDAAAGPAVERCSNSRRLTANADHANGPTADPPPSEPAPNHANNRSLSPNTEPVAGAAVITGATDAVAAAAAAGAATDVTDVTVADAGRAAAGALAAAWARGTLTPPDGVDTGA